MTGVKSSTGCLTLLSQLLLGADGCRAADQSAGEVPPPGWAPEIARTVGIYGRQDFGELWSLATSHHVIMRAFPALHEVMVAQGKEEAQWCENAILKESARVELQTIGDTAIKEKGRLFGPNSSCGRQSGGSSLSSSPARAAGYLASVR